MSDTLRTTTDLHEATAIEQAAPDRFLIDVPDGWQQGRGAFGGVVLGSMARALGAYVADPGRVMRSLTGNLAGPVMPGRAEIHIDELRRGSGVSMVSAKLIQGGEALAQATGVFARGRGLTQPWGVGAPPVAPRWRDVQAAPIEPPLGPVFARHFVFRPTGPLPFTSQPSPLAAGWIGTRSPLTTLGAPEIVAFADTWWPTIFATEAGPRPTATIAYTLEICADLATLDPATPLFLRSQGVAHDDGYFIEFRELWSEAGALVALNQQTFAIIR
jgi:hypothetical protein